MYKKIYFIPGTQCNEKLWHKLARYLLETHELIYLSIPHNKSFNEIAKDLKQHIAEQKITLVGFSLGGYIASYFATRYPEHIERLFIISNCPSLLPELELQKRVEQLRLVKQYGYKGLSKQAAVKLLDPDSLDESITDTMIEMDKELGITGFLSQYKLTSHRENLLPVLMTMPFKIVFYFSEYDSLVNKQLLEHYEKSASQCVLYCEYGSGHMLPLEKPRQLANLIVQIR